jgi:ubiquinone/menaquinone biosynthesis C-methylase UbiE
MQFDANAFLSAPTSELEKLSWYEMISRMGLSSFNWSGEKPIELIIKTLKIDASKRVLMVGCGAGGTTIYLAELTGATIFGIDIEEQVILKAQTDAQKSNAKERIQIRLGDAHHLPYEDGSFDVVITEFMAFFLKPSAFKEFFRVLRPGGCLALAELMIHEGMAGGFKNDVSIQKIFN